MEKSETYTDLSTVAMDMLENIPKPIIIVCGPISTGGKGNVRANLEVFDKTIQKLIGMGINIFDQMPFEKHLGRLNEKSEGSKEEKNQVLLDEFYKPLYKSGHIRKFYFIHGWESSHGARWERSMAKDLGIEIEDLPEDFLE